MGQSGELERILVVDDVEMERTLLAQGLAHRGYAVVEAASAEEALELLKDTDVDAVVTDLEMPKMDGIELTRRIIDNRDIPVVLLTGQGTMDAAIEGLRAGLDDFLTKPVELDRLGHALSRALEMRRLRREVKRLRDSAPPPPQFQEMIGNSRAIVALQDLIVRVAPAEVSVLITGESGTGKELVARALHALSPRAKGPFVALNTAALPSGLLESELFGHVDGAFTDAVGDRDGLLVQAAGGTIFLDEVGDMPLDMQAKLLRALQERCVRPVGGSREIELDVRLVTATHQDLEEAIEDGRFREDLYYRINVVRLSVPPLRSRGEDVLLIAQYLIERAAKRSGRSVTGLSAAAAAKMMAYDWPGNVRELENAIERAVTLARFEEITPDDLPEKVHRYEVPVGEMHGSADDTVCTMEELERRHIRHVLELADGNKSRAARILGFDRRTLYRKLERYGMDVS